jgi:hypothetical protein
MRKALLASLIAIGSLAFFEGHPQASDYGEDVSEYRLAAEDGRDHGAVYKGLDIKGIAGDFETPGTGDSDAASDSNGKSAVSVEELTPAQWAAVLGLMALNFWLARRRGRNGWRWFFGTLVLNVLATLYLLVTKPLPGSPLAVKKSQGKKATSGAPESDASAASGMVDQGLLQELRAIKGVGESTADKVAARFPTRAAVSQASRSQLEAIKGVGEKQASLIRAHFL